MNKSQENKPSKEAKECNVQLESDLHMHNDESSSTYGSELARALSDATHVTNNEVFDPSESPKDLLGGKDLRTNLKNRWDDLVRATAASSSEVTTTTDEWFQKIYEKHVESGRHYHTVIHLWEMFELLDIVMGCIQHSASSHYSQKWYVPIAWSVFFHDSIYDPKSNRNEKDSSDLFREFVQTENVVSMDGITYETVITMILATEKHEVISAIEVETHDPEFVAKQELFLDIDMSVLGKKTNAYLTYAGLIRKEYEFVSHDVYCRKRAEILENFLNGNSTTNETPEPKYVYITDAFRTAFENRAKENLRNEIDLLRRKIIPG